MILTVSSVGGSPGVTSSSLMLAAAWPPETLTERVVVEADADGAVLGARFGLGVEPGTAALASLCRRHSNGALDIDHIARRVDPMVSIIPGPESAEAASQLWASSDAASEVARAAANDDRVWIFDVGRARPDGALGAIFDHAAMSIVVCRAEHDALVQVPSRIAAIARTGRSTGVIVCGRPAFDQRELVQFFGAEATWVLRDADLVGTSRAVWNERRVRRSQLWRATVSIASDIATSVITPELFSVAETEFDVG